jgi:UDP-glucose 4-epimerase
MRCLVTGCAGFIGSQLTESLLAENNEVTGVDCLNDNYPSSQKLANLERALNWDTFTFVAIDLARGNLETLVDECDVVFHLAGEPGVRASWGSRFSTYVRNNITATHVLLQTLADMPGRRLVYASSSSIYGQAETFPTPEDVIPKPFSPYGITKLSGEQLCQAYNANYNVDTVCLRYFSVYGPRQRPDMAFTIFCQAALKGTPITVFGDGQQTRDFTFVGDIVHATRTAAIIPQAEGGVYNVGGGTQVSLAEAIEILRGIAGRPIDVNYRDVEKGDVRNTGADTSAAKRDLGFLPTTDFTDGLGAQFEWMRRIC